MPTTRRQERVGELLQEELSTLIQQEAQDPRLSGVTITDVQVSPDLGHARVLVSIRGDDVEQRAALRALEHATGFMRRELAGRLELRRVPTLSFHIDKSIARGQRILDLIESIKTDSGDLQDDQGAE